MAARGGAPSGGARDTPHQAAALPVHAGGCEPRGPSAEAARPKWLAVRVLKPMASAPMQAAPEDQRAVQPAAPGRSHGAAPEAWSCIHPSANGPRKPPMFPMELTRAIETGCSLLGCTE